MKKDLLGIKQLNEEEILNILTTASSFKDVLQRDIKKVPALRGKTVVNLFFEPSTRTRTSFELAEKRLSTDVLNFSIPTSSVVKGESLLDTVKTMQSYGADYIVIRHQCSGVPHRLSRFVKGSVINAGDGINEHPTQALLDAFTIKEKKGEIKGLNIAIIGDIVHSRVARSNTLCLLKLGANIRYIAPATLLPNYIPQEIKTFYNIDEGIKDADVIMALRVQKERMDKAFFPSEREYFKLYGLTPDRLQKADSQAIVMHPGPMNRGIEISSDVADSNQSVILDQVTNGIAVRMAVLYLFGGNDNG
ncbi:MAG: aspartate carbamoyltransferase catalytic subunit [Thermodesulfovibrionales bacterium]|nr:aspartate carbamoyltransferase catalytic subunit [Thermodesulfovibrionales bacterium]